MASAQPADSTHENQDAHGAQQISEPDQESSNPEISPRDPPKSEDPGLPTSLSSQKLPRKPVTVAIAGCAHGEMDKIYETIRFTEKENGIKVDLLLCCGDFQAVRNYSDLKCMAVPTKYQTLQTFYKYYSGECMAPYLTVFVGGNHEASNYLAELPYGGWVAPNIYYLGYAGVVNFRGLKIAGLSGIYRSREFNKGHYECPPYGEDTKRTAYYLRNLEMFRLKQMKKSSGNSVDIMLSHDWPVRITEFGDSNWLFKKKAFFKDEAIAGSLGNHMGMLLLKEIKPKFWFSAHLHVKFPALVPHDDGTETRFLALDKCLPHRGFLQIMDMEPSSLCETESDLLEFDPEWLAVLKSTDHLWNTTKYDRYMPGPGMGSDERYDFVPTESEIAESKAILNQNMKIPHNFVHTAPPHVGPESKRSKSQAQQSLYYRNPQTTDFCEKIGIFDLNAFLIKENPSSEGTIAGSIPVFKPEMSDPIGNPDEIDLDIDAIDDEENEPENSLKEPVTKGDEVTDLDEKLELEGFVAPTLKRKSTEEEAEEEKKEESEGGSVMAKFKRRNAAAYQCEEEDDD